MFRFLSKSCTTKCNNQLKDKEGNEFSGSFIDLSARIILHEYDHLNGYTFFDRAKPMHMSQAKKRRKIYIRKARRQAKEMA